MPTVRKEKELIINIKFRNYSDDVMGYRVLVGGETHYIVNEIYRDEALSIADKLLDYPDNWFVTLLKGNKLYVEKTESDKIVNLDSYRTKKIFESLR